MDFKQIMSRSLVPAAFFGGQEFERRRLTSGEAEQAMRGLVEGAIPGFLGAAAGQVAMGNKSFSDIAKDVAKDFRKRDGVNKFLNKSTGRLALPFIAGGAAYGALNRMMRKWQAENYPYVY